MSKANVQGDPPQPADHVALVTKSDRTGNAPGVCCTREKVRILWKRFKQEGGKEGGGGTWVEYESGMVPVRLHTQNLLFCKIYVVQQHVCEHAAHKRVLSSPAPPFFPAPSQTLFEQSNLAMSRHTIPHCRQCMEAWDPCHQKRCKRTVPGKATVQGCNEDLLKHARASLALNIPEHTVQRVAYLLFLKSNSCKDALRQRHV